MEGVTAAHSPLEMGVLLSRRGQQVEGAGPRPYAVRLGANLAKPTSSGTRRTPSPGLCHCQAAGAC
jgi:hypothetical protein